MDSHTVFGGVVPPDEVVVAGLVDVDPDEVDAGIVRIDPVLIRRFEDYAVRVVDDGVGFNGVSARRVEIYPVLAADDAVFSKPVR